MRSWPLGALLVLGLLSGGACKVEDEVPATLEERLLRAAKRGDLRAVKVLLERGADIEAPDKNPGWTPLIWMAVSSASSIAT